MRPWSIIPLVTLAAALPGCSDTPAEPAGVAPPPVAAAVATDHTVTRSTFTFVYQNPCNGENVAFTGERVEQITAVGPQELLDQGLALRFEDQTRITGTGVGEETGTVYRIRDLIHFGVRSPSAEALNFTEVFNEKIHAIAQGSTGNFVIHANFHVTVLPNGRIATSFGPVTAQCGG